MLYSLDMADIYVRPELYPICVEAECGFSQSTTLDDMYETIGTWE